MILYSIIHPRFKCRIFSKRLIFISCSPLLISTLIYMCLTSESGSAFRQDLKQLILNQIVYTNPLPCGAKADVIYVLGGSPESLELKYKTAAELFHNKVCRKIWILSRPGKTCYSDYLKRNLTNDEWSLLQLNEFGVPGENVEAIQIKEGFFGTFSEARGISVLLKRRRYQDIILISSPYHTYRTRISFQNFSKNQNTSIYVHASDERVWLRHLLVEFIKLKIYQYFLVRTNRLDT